MNDIFDEKVENCEEEQSVGGENNQAEQSVEQSTEQTVEQPVDTESLSQSCERDGEELADSQVCEGGEVVESDQERNGELQNGEQESVEEYPSEVPGDEKTCPCANEKQKGGGIISTIILFIFCAFIAFTNFAWIYCVQVDGTSMNATLQTEDYLFVDRLAKIERGDVIVFTRENLSAFEGGYKSYIKRIVGMPGDTLRFKDGKLYLMKEGENYFTPVEYEGVIGDTYFIRGDGGTEQTITVSKDCVFVLGDNRENSTDSRAFGEVEISTIDGVVHQFVIDSKDGFLGKVCESVFKVREIFHKKK